MNLMESKPKSVDSTRTTIIISDETDLSGSLYKPYKMLYIPEEVN